MKSSFFSSLSGYVGTMEPLFVMYRRACMARSASFGSPRTMPALQNSARTPHASAPLSLKRWFASIGEFARSGSSDARSELFTCRHERTPCPT